MDERQDATHPAPAACASGPLWKNPPTHPSDSVRRSALTMQSDLLEFPTAIGGWCRQGCKRSEVCECSGRSMCHRNGWPGSDWCAMDIATAPEQISHVVWEIKRCPEFHHESSSSSPRVVRKVIPASSNENRGHELVEST